MLTRNKLYLLILVACAAGYIWIAITFYFQADAKNETFGVCLFKHTTNIPCPSCGSTRSVISLLQGNWMGSLLINPLGFPIALLLLVAPLWILADYIRKSNSFFDFYIRTEIYLKKPWVAIPLVALVLLNWIWNISKGL
jgi:hypothetical protein